MRERIVMAALQVIREHGIAAMTTKQIARTAQVAEGSIYNHFENKTALVGAAMTEVASGIRSAMTRLLGRTGTGRVEDNLAELAEAAIAFFLDLLPIAGPVLGDREQLAWLRATGPSAGGPERPAPGPLLGQQTLIGYLEAERTAGRIPAETVPPLLASALLGMCQNYAFLTLMSGADAVAANAGLPADHPAQARAIARTVLAASGGVGAASAVGAVGGADSADTPAAGGPADRRAPSE
jgi:AcrR family transcriptional regulator